MHKMPDRMASGGALALEPVGVGPLAPRIARLPCCLFSHLFLRSDVSEVRSDIGLLNKTCDLRSDISKRHLRSDV